MGGYNGAGGGIICYAFNPGNICSPSLYSLTISGNYTAATAVGLRPRLSVRHQ